MIEKFKQIRMKMNKKTALFLPLLLKWLLFSFFFSSLLTKFIEIPPTAIAITSILNQDFETQMRVYLNWLLSSRSINFFRRNTQSHGDEYSFPSILGDCTVGNSNLVQITLQCIAILECDTTNATALHYPLHLEYTTTIQSCITRCF